MNIYTKCFEQEPSVYLMKEIPCKIMFKKSLEKSIKYVVKIFNKKKKEICNAAVNKFNEKF